MTILSNMTSGLVQDSQSSEHVITECAASAPLEFVRELFPRFVRFDKAVPRERIMAPNMQFGPDDQLREGLSNAMKSLAQEDPAGLDYIIAAESPSESRWMAALMLRVWSANPHRYSERIVSFLLERPKQRLTIGYDMSMGQTDGFAAVGRTAIAAASVACSDKSFADLEAAILGYATDWEQSDHRASIETLVLLRALAQHRLGERARREMEGLSQRFPDVSEHGAPEEPKDRVMAQWVGPPIPADKQEDMSDDEWLAAMSRYTSEWGTMEGGQFVGGTVELSQGLSVLVRQQPTRFVALADRMTVSHPSIYFEAILEGLTHTEGSSGPLGTVEQVGSVLRRIGDLRVSVRGAAVARAVGTLANETLPDDIVQMLCRIALEDPDPDTDNWHGPDVETGPINQAINSARGSAATALADLLFADRGRWSNLKPTIEKLVVDQVLAVRSEAVRCLLAVLDVNRDDAFAGFGKLSEGADPILGSFYVKQFIHYAMFRDYPVIRPTLLRMLESSEPAAMRAGAGHVALASLWLDEADGDEELALKMGVEARAGVAEIYAQNVADKTVGAECEKFLCRLFNDESEVVRREAARCWITLDADQIAARGSLLGAFAESMGSGGGVNMLLYRLKDSPRPLPAELCDIAEGAVAAYGFRASSIQYSEAGTAYTLAPLMVRLHEETGDPEFQERILDVIDDMVRAGFMGIDESLHKQHDR